MQYLFSPEALSLQKRKIVTAIMNKHVNCKCGGRAFLKALQYLLYWSWTFLGSGAVSQPHHVLELLPLHIL